MTGLNFNRPAFLVGVVLLSMGVGAATAAVTVNSMGDSGVNDVSPANDSINESEDVSVASTDLSYTGLNATTLTVTVGDKNDDGTAHTVDTHVRLYDRNTGEILYAATNTSTSVTGDTTVDFPGVDAHIEDWNWIDVNVEQTG